jgi:hypothetical protein
VAGAFGPNSADDEGAAEPDGSGHGGRRPFLAGAAGNAGGLWQQSIAAIRFDVLATCSATSGDRVAVAAPPHPDRPRVTGHLLPDKTLHRLCQRRVKTDLRTTPTSAVPRSDDEPDQMDSVTSLRNQPICSRRPLVRPPRSALHPT